MGTQKITLVCPHCASTGSYDWHHTPSSSGTDYIHCKSCKKRFTVHYKNGHPDKVSK